MTKRKYAVLLELTVELIRRGHLTNLAAKMYISLVHGDAELDSTLEAFDAAITAVR
jgi:hypothetical protein